MVPGDGIGPRVSIIMPVFNVGRLLGEALDSVGNQTYRDLETVLVDDGSTDPITLALLEEASRRRATTVHRTTRRGPAAARNLAVARSRGAYVLPLDADDYLGPRFLEKTVPILEGRPEVGVAYTWVGLTGGHHGVWRTGGFSAAELLSRCTIHVTSLYRRELWADIGGYDEGFVEGAEDWDFWLGAAARGWKGQCVPEVLTYYRRTPTSRERGARAPGVGGRLVRRLVAKHRGLYEAHLEEAIAGLYEEHAAVCLSLERVYDHPVVRAALWLRDRLRPRPTA